MMRGGVHQLLLCAALLSGGAALHGPAAAHNYHMGITDISYNANTGSTEIVHTYTCLLYTSPSPRDRTRSRMPSSA